MRPVPAHQVADAVTITARYPAVHGAPVHIGEPQALGIRDINKPDFGDPVTSATEKYQCSGPVALPQAAVMASRVPFAVSHAPATCLSPIFRTPHGNNNKDVMCDFLPCSLSSF